MKKLKTIKKKNLKLKKETIASLENSQLNQLKGKGGDDNVFTFSWLPTCPTTY
jgi:hypothetical protein